MTMRIGYRPRTYAAKIMGQDECTVKGKFMPDGTRETFLAFIKQIGRQLFGETAEGYGDCEKPFRNGGGTTIWATAYDYSRDDLPEHKVGRFLIFLR